MSQSPSNPSEKTPTALTSKGFRRRPSATTLAERMAAVRFNLSNKNWKKRAIGKRRLPSMLRPGEPMPQVISDFVEASKKEGVKPRPESLIENIPVDTHASNVSSEMLVDRGKGDNVGQSSSGRVEKGSEACSEERRESTPRLVEETLDEEEIDWTDSEEEEGIAKEKDEQSNIGGCSSSIAASKGKKVEEAEKDEQSNIGGCSSSIGVSKGKKAEEVEKEKEQPSRKLKRKFGEEDERMEKEKEDDDDEVEIIGATQQKSVSESKRAGLV